MIIAVQQCYVLVAAGSRSYTFTPLPGGVEVAVQFAGPRHSNKVTMPSQEARDLWLRLRKCGYERW